MSPSVLTIVLLLLLPIRQQTGEDVHILIRKSAFSLVLYKGQEVTKRYSVCIGKNPGNKQQTGDRRTPEGDFVISQIQNSRHWVHDFGDGKGPVAGAYGPWFLRLKAVSGKNWKGIGIHGTHDPASINTRASEGCVRMKNEELRELKRLVHIGTPVTILP
jgi:lipoprotein-anchoring transpeptidase ErfK/SrfK